MLGWGYRRNLDRKKPHTVVCGAPPLRGPCPRWGEPASFGRRGEIDRDKVAHNPLALATTLVLLGGVGQRADDRLDDPQLEPPVEEEQEPDDRQDLLAQFAHLTFAWRNFILR